MISAALMTATASTEQAGVLSLVVSMLRWCWLLSSCILS